MIKAMQVTIVVLCWSIERKSLKIACTNLSIWSWSIKNFTCTPTRSSFKL